MTSYRSTAQERIAEILRWHNIYDPKAILDLHPEERRLLKKDMECNCPFERRGLAFKIWETELRILFGIEARKEDPVPAKRAVQVELFG